MSLLEIHLPDPGEVFPYSIPLLRGTRTLALDPALTILVGENGSGKSTILETLALAADLPAAGAHDPWRDPTLAALKPFATETRLVWDARSNRGAYLRAEDYFGYAQRLRAEKAHYLTLAREAERGMVGVHDLERARRLAPYLISAYAAEATFGGDLDERSHGESFLAFFQARLRGRGLYLLDEPEAALSPLRLLAFASLVRDAIRRGAQFVIATHSPMLMAIPDAQLLLLDDTGARRVAWDDIPSVATLRAFFADPGAFWRHL